MFVSVSRTVRVIWPSKIASAKLESFGLVPGVQATSLCYYYLRLEIRPKCAIDKGIKYLSSVIPIWSPTVMLINRAAAYVRQHPSFQT